jgi:SAM-dependent methyltransferase
MTSPELPDSVARNVAEWTASNAAYTDASALRAWSRDDITWGVFGVPEATVGSLGDVAGLDVVELGCGTAYISARLARQGARPVGVDPTPAQLATARRMMDETGIAFPLVEAPAEKVPLPDASFDVAVSEYGASLWAVPERWIAEAARLLRPGGRLVFLGNATLLMLCVHDYEADDPAGDRLQRNYFGMHRFEWPDSDGVEFHLGYGDMIRLLRSSGFEVEDLVELRPPEGATTRYPYVDAAWARRWPSEQVWKARKRAG